MVSHSPIISVLHDWSGGPIRHELPLPILSINRRYRDDDASGWHGINGALYKCSLRENHRLYEYFFLALPTLFTFYRRRSWAARAGAAATPQVRSSRAPLCICTLLAEMESPKLRLLIGRRFERTAQTNTLGTAYSDTWTSCRCTAWVSASGDVSSRPLMPLGRARQNTPQRTPRRHVSLAIHNEDYTI